MALSLTVFAVNPRDMKFPSLKFEPPEPVRYVADNGLVVYFLEDHQLPVFSVTALFHGGTVHDPADMVGLAEITARLMRTGGAGKRTAQQVDQDLDFVGADLSSQATNDNLLIDLSALKKDADLGWEILSDVVQKPLFDTGQVALEISNKKDEIRRQNDDPRYTNPSDILPDHLYRTSLWIVPYSGHDG